MSDLILEIDQKYGLKIFVSDDNKSISFEQPRDDADGGDPFNTVYVSIADIPRIISTLQKTFGNLNLENEA